MILVPNKIFENNGLTIYAKVCYVILKHHANAHGVCYPGRKRIANMGGFSVTTYKKVINLLEKYGHIKRLERFKRTRGQTSNLFIVEKICKKDKFFKVREDIFDLGLSTREIAVYCYLCKCGAVDGCVPRQSEIAAGCNMSVRCVISAIKALRENGLLQTEQTQFSSTGAHSALLYIFTKTSAKNKDKEISDKRVRAISNTTVQTVKHHVFTAIGSLKDIFISCKNVYNVLTVPAVTFTPGGYYIRDRQ